MSKRQKTIRLIVASIIFLISAFMIYTTICCAHDMLHLDFGAVSVLVLIGLSIITSPILLFCIIFQIVMLVKKKFYIWDFISSILFVLTWASLYIVPILINAFYYN